MGRWLSPARLARPGTDPADPLHRYMCDVARRWIIHGGKFDIRSEVDMGQSLQQGRSAALGDVRATVDDEVLIEPEFVARARLDRERNPRITAYVADLAVLGQVSGHELLAFEPDPHDRYLGSPVRLEGD